MKIMMTCAVLLIFALGHATAAEENVKFSGTLVALPCTIPDSDRTILVHMGTVNAHDLYLHQEMPRVPFILHLENCDTTIKNKVGIIFKGVEDVALPGFIAIDKSGSGASGIAIGLEKNDSGKINLNQEIPMYSLQQGNNDFSFMAHVEGEPDAVKRREINAGDFNAVILLELDYE